MRRRSGFTLAEVLISITLMALLLGEMTLLFRTGLRWGTTSSARMENEATARAALQTVLGEARQATSVEEPAAKGPVLEFTRPGPDIVSTDFHVRYRVLDGHLLRKTWSGATEPADAADNVMEVLSGVASVEFEVDNEPLFVRMTVVADRQVLPPPKSPSPSASPSPSPRRPSSTVTLSGGVVSRAGL